MANYLPPPPTNDQTGSFAWLEWFRQLRNYITQTGSVPWGIINFAGSNISDIASRSHQNLQALQGGTTGQYYHLPQTTVDDVTAYMSGGSPGYGWNDILADLNGAKVTGASQPSWSLFRDGIYAHSFSATAMNECWITIHVNHDYNPGSSIYPHIHWSTTGTNTGVVRWGIEYTVAKGHNQQAFGASTTVYIEQAASGTAYKHMISEVSDGNAIASTNLEPDSLILCRIFRDAAHGNDTCTDTAFAFMADVHYQVDRTSTKNKAPNFYT